MNWQRLASPPIWTRFVSGLRTGLGASDPVGALMLFPIMVSQGHIAAMAAVSFVMISDRLEQPRPLRWRLRIPGKLMRIVVAQTRIRLQGMQSGSRQFSMI